MRAPAEKSDTPNPLLTGPLRSTLFLLALPVLGEQLLNFLVGFYDVYLSGHLPASVTAGEPGIGVAATSAVGVAAYVSWLASMVFGLVSHGTTALISRAWSSGDRVQANRIANRSIVLAAVTGLVFMVVIQFACRAIVRLMGLEGVAVDIAVNYLRWDAAGLFVASISFVIAAAFRGCGDTRTPLLVFAGVNAVNIVVSTWLVYGGWGVPSFGVTGIVLGTVAARVTGGVVSLALLAAGVRGLRLQSSELRLGGETARRILRIGVPAAAEGLVMWAGHCLFLRVISHIGPETFAAHIVGVRVEAITYLPAVAWGAAAATLVGQSLGVGDQRRAIQAGHEAARQCGLFGLVITLWFTLGAESIFRLMHTDPAVREIGAGPFRVVGLFQIPLILSIVYFAALRGAGATRFPLVATAITTFAFRIPVGYVCGVTLGGGLMGAWAGMNLDMLLRSLCAVGRYARTDWVETRV